MNKVEILIRMPPLLLKATKAKATAEENPKTREGRVPL
jgi:hypothetical protein